MGVVEHLQPSHSRERGTQVPVDALDLLDARQMQHQLVALDIQLCHRRLIEHFIFWEASSSRTTAMAAMEFTTNFRGPFLSVPTGADPAGARPGVTRLEVLHGGDTGHEL